jgi:Fic family protein
MMAPINMSDNYWNMKPDKGKAMMLARRQLSELVWDAVNLEGINFTLPEIQTLLQGITVGGHRLSDQQIALNQAKAWQTLFQWIEDDTFELSAEKTCELHAIAAEKEALEWGRFRPGGVTIAGTEYMPPDASELPVVFDNMVKDALTFTDIYDQAIFVFLYMARAQFFYDVNKRMGRFMMNGLLLNAGFPAINLPAKRQLEFNRLMLTYYDSGEQQPMNTFLRSCLDERMIRIMREGSD